jgi:hypothetical protein
LNANEYEVSFYYDSDDLKYASSEGNLTVKDWCPIYKGTLKYANTSSVVKYNTVNSVTRYYTKVTTSVPTLSFADGVATITDVPATFVCVLLDDSTSRDIIRPSLTKEQVIGTLAVYYDQQSSSTSMTVAAFDALTTLLS